MEAIWFYVRLPDGWVPRGFTESKDRFAARLDAPVKGQDRAKVRLVPGERKGGEG